MQLFTIFEPYLIPDKAYPPLSEGNLVRLSFRMECTRLETTREQQERFMHLDDAEYRFSGRVALLYNKPHPFMIIEARGFRFYTLAPRALRLKRGSWTDGTGTLLLLRRLVLSRLGAPFSSLQLPRSQHLQGAHS